MPFDVSSRRAMALFISETGCGEAEVFRGGMLVSLFLLEMVNMVKERAEQYRRIGSNYATDSAPSLRMT